MNGIIITVVLLASIFLNILLVTKFWIFEIGSLLSCFNALGVGLGVWYFVKKTQFDIMLDEKKRLVELLNKLINLIREYGLCVESLAVSSGDPEKDPKKIVLEIQSAYSRMQALIEVVAEHKAQDSTGLQKAFIRLTRFVECSAFYRLDQKGTDDDINDFFAEFRRCRDAMDRMVFKMILDGY